MIDLKELIDVKIQELDDFVNNQESLISSNSDDSESSVIINAAFLDGVKSTCNKSKNELRAIRREVNNDSPHIDPPPKELAEFKAEVLKDMRKKIRERFNHILQDIKPPSGTPPGQPLDIAYQKLTQELLRFDKELLNQIASIRHELPIEKNSMVANGQIRV